MDAAPTVFLIDDDEATRDALCFLFKTVGLRAESYTSGNDFLARMPAGRDGCIVTDVRMPGISGLDLQRNLAAQGIDLPVIVLTAFGDVRMAIRAMAAGAFNFVEKPFNDQELLDSVRRALQSVASRPGEKEPSSAVLERQASLTPRERQTLDLILEGEPSKRIAFALGIGAKTVEFHRANMMEKMGARSVADLVRMVVSANASKGKP